MCVCVVYRKRNKTDGSDHDSPVCLQKERERKSGEMEREMSGWRYNNSSERIKKLERLFYSMNSAGLLWGQV